MEKPSISELSLTEKIAQLLMVSQGHLEYRFENNGMVARTMDEVNEIMTKYQYGSIYAYGAVGKPKLDADGITNVTGMGQVTTEQHKSWLNALQKNVRLPMLFGMDSENGLRYAFKDASQAAPPLSIGAANDEELTRKLAKGIALEHKAAGSNWRWAPVLDIGNRFSGLLIGRTYSDDIERLTRLATATMQGMESENVATTVKHFPGADIYEFRDSHIVTTVINSSLEEWEEKQGKVFQNMIDAGVMTIMTSHTAFPAVDDEKIKGNYIPASFSKKIITDLLRKKMGFEGVIITDDVAMGGITTICSREEKLIRMINAGHDILLGVDPYDFDLVYNAVCDGRIPMERIDKSCERVLALKEKIGLFDEKNKQEVDIWEANKIITETSRGIAEKSITLLYDKNNLLPLSKETIKKVAIVCVSHAAKTIEQLEVMKTEFEKRGAKTDLYDGVNRETYANIVDQHDFIVYVGHISQHRPLGMPSFYDEKMDCFRSAFTRDKEKSMGVSTGYPYVHHDAMQGADTFANIYSCAPECQKAFVKAVYGEIPFVGTSPIDIEPKLRYVYC